MVTTDGSTGADGGLPDRPLAGIRHVDLPDVEVTAELAERRLAVTELGDALRQLTSTSIGTEVEIEVLRQATAEIRLLASRLAERQRSPGEPASVDDLQRGQRLFNPVVGPGNPIAPPMRVEIADGSAIGTCTLDWRYEGPFTYGHGGVSAMLLDQIMGYAAAAAGHPSVTGRLQVRYFSAVPLDVPLRIEGELIDVLGVRAAVRGSISLASAPDVALVEADGRFLALRPEQAVRLFGGEPDPAD